MRERAQLTSQELIDEGVQDLLLSRQNIDRALMARLMLDPQDGLQRPFYYLLDSYSRASKELRAIAAYKDQQLVEALKATALQTQELIIFHGNLVLTLDLFPKVCLTRLLQPREHCHICYKLGSPGIVTTAQSMRAVSRVSPRGL